MKVIESNVGNNRFQNYYLLFKPNVHARAQNILNILNFKFFTYLQSTI